MARLTETAADKNDRAPADGWGDNGSMPLAEVKRIVSRKDGTCAALLEANMSAQWVKTTSEEVEKIGDSKCCSFDYVWDKKGKYYKATNLRPCKTLTMDEQIDLMF
jgi:hypothetical protein